MYKIMDGLEVSLEHEKVLKEKYKGIKAKLVIIKASENKEVDKYIARKIKKCNSFNIDVVLKEYNTDVLEETIIDDIKNYNDDKEVDGIIVELPLYDHLDEDKIINTVSFLKDIDGLTNKNIENLINEKECFIPCTVKGILSLIDYYDINLTNKKVTIINRGRLIGKPLYYYLQNKKIDVSMVGSTTNNIKEICKDSDVLITGIGKNIIDSSYVKENAVVIDAGINVVDNKVYGDVSFDEVKNACSYITPVPNGVGPMTIISLIENLYDSYVKNRK